MDRDLEEETDEHATDEHASQPPQPILPPQPSLARTGLRGRPKSTCQLELSAALALCAPAVRRRPRSAPPQCAPAAKSREPSAAGAVVMLQAARANLKPRDGVQLTRGVQLARGVLHAARSWSCGAKLTPELQPLGSCFRHFQRNRLYPKKVDFLFFHLLPKNSSS